MAKIQIELDESQALEILASNDSKIQTLKEEIKPLEAKLNALLSQNETIQKALNGVAGTDNEKPKYLWRKEIREHWDQTKEDIDAEIVAVAISERDNITNEAAIKFIKNQISIGLAGLFSEKKILRKPKKDKPSEFWYHFKKEATEAAS
jgi:hypothetical protein